MNIRQFSQALEELSEIEIQKRIWLGDSNDEQSSFEEAVCRLFDDAGLGKALESSSKNDNINHEFWILAKKWTL
jgi:hypothetical protein